MRLLILAILTAGALPAASNPCVLEGEARTALRTWNTLPDKTPFLERRKQLDDLAAKYPAAYQIQRQRQNFYRYSAKDGWAGMRDAYVQRAEQNPSDPLALTLAASALHRTDTPRAIELLNKARSIAPDYPWAALKLADIYQSGKFEDKAKARTNLDVYLSACSDYYSQTADWIVSKLADRTAQAALARRLRARLDADVAPEADDYQTLWSLEFRSRPPAEHPELRKQVAKDVERLLSLHPDKNSFDALLTGVKQSGASKEAVTAFEDHILKEAPASSPAYDIVRERWKEQHKDPEDPKDLAAWEAWKKVCLAALKQWVEQFPDLTSVESIYREKSLDSGLVEEKEGVAGLEKQVRTSLAQQGPSMWTYYQPAWTLLKKGWAPKKAYEWLEKAWPLAVDADRENLENDTLTKERRDEITGGLGNRGSMAGDYLRAMKLAGKTNVPATVREYLDGPLPTKKSEWEERYHALAWLAAVDGREADALAYFQQALFSRTEPPKYRGGKLEDPLLDQAKEAFLKTGGTEKAFALWSKAPGKVQELAEGRWEKPTKTLPAFELADLTGRTWKLKQLEGKAVLINLWATWCGPCKAELPQLQKLYEQTKDRADVQVISFNIDEDLGLVEPFMKEKGFTFPALPALSLVQGILDGIGIPQNWIVDPKGTWIATQIGFDSADTDWTSSMLQRLERAKQGKAPASTN